MKALLQRVSFAQVSVSEALIASIEKGLLVFVGFEQFDRKEIIEKMIYKILHYRIFEDVDGKMNKNVQEINGGVLLVPQFTLAATTDKGLRPSFSTACLPETSKQRFDYVIQHAKTLYKPIHAGCFGAYMAIKLCNDGPVTFLLSS